ncbi:MAG: hypothetical protein WCO78_05005 [Candidatus Roizmanbacteria bacterium]
MKNIIVETRVEKLKQFMTGERAIQTQEIRLGSEVTTFSRTLLNLWAESNDHTSFSYSEPVAENDRVSKVEKDGFITVTMPPNPTAQDILEASRLVNEQASEKNTPLKLFTKNLRDGAILLANNQAFAAEENNDIVELLYNLGNNLDCHNATAVALQRKDIQSLPIIHPEGADPEKYTDYLMLFLLGKNTVLSSSTPSTNSKLKSHNEANEDPQNSFYSAFYSRWRKKQAKAEDSELTRQEFDTMLLKRLKNPSPHGLSSLLGSYINDSLKKGRGQIALHDLVEQASSHELESAIANRGIDYIREELKNPPLINDIDPLLLLRIRSIYGDISFFKNSKLFESAKMVLESIKKEKGEKGKPVNTKDTIATLCEIVQAYKYRETFKPSLIVANQEFECVLKSYVLGELMQQHIGSDVIVFSAQQSGHMRLVVAEKETLDTNSPVMYFVDPTAESRYVYLEDKRDERSTSKPIQTIEDRNFIDQVIEAYKQNPNDIHVNCQIDGYQGVLPIQTIDSFKQGTEAALWHNSAQFASTREDRIQCLKKAVEYSPNNSTRWNDLANNLINVNDKIKCYKRALELEPDLWKANFALSSIALTEDERRKYSDRATAGLDLLIRSPDVLDQMSSSTLLEISTFTKNNEYKWDLLCHADTKAEQEHASPTVRWEIKYQMGLHAPKFRYKQHHFLEAMEFAPNIAFLQFYYGWTGPPESQIEYIQKAAEAATKGVGVKYLFKWAKQEYIRPDDMKSARQTIMMFKELLKIADNAKPGEIPPDDIEYARSEIQRIETELKQYS